MQFKGLGNHIPNHERNLNTIQKRHKEYSVKITFKGLGNGI